MGGREVADVARDQGQVVMKGGRGQQPIDDWQGCSLAPGSGSEQPPTIRHRRIDRQYPAGETAAQVHLQPSLQPRPPPALGKSGQALAEIPQRQDTEVEQCFLGGFHPLQSACPTKQQSRNQRYAVSIDRQAGRVPLGRRLPACPTESSQAAKV